MTTPSLETIQFCAATSGYRIVRLSIELFLIEHSLEAGYSVATAGLLFLVGNICDVVCNIIFLNYPYLFLRSKIGSALFVIGSPIMIVSGYVGFFVSTKSLIQMVVCIGLCGMGISAWYVNYKTLYSTAYSKQSTGQLAQLRQGFESIGFLLPSICLAVVSISKKQQQQDNIIDNISSNNNYSSSSSSFTTITTAALILAGLASIFFMISMPIMYIYACQVSSNSKKQQQHEKQQQQLSVWESIKTFFTTSVLHFFFINTVILALFNVLSATLSTVSTMYFALDALDLWIAAIGFPIGGIISAVLALTLGSFKANKRFMISTSFLVFVFTIMTCTITQANLFFTNNENNKASKFLFFMFGLIVGYFCSEAWTVSFALWLKNLNSYPQSFINQANALGNMGDKLLMALIFQGQTLALDYVLDNDDDDDDDNDINLQAVGIVIFVPFIILIGISTLLVIFRPNEYFDMPKLTGRGDTRISPITKLACRFVSIVSGIALEPLLYGAFIIFRYSSFSKHLIDVEVQDTIQVDFENENANYNNNKWNLSVDDLRDYLTLFTANNSPSSSPSSSSFTNRNNKEEWFVSKENVKLHRVLFDNHDALQTRLDMIDSAKHSIWILTWSLDGHVFDLLADKLIQKYKRDNVQINIIVDRSLIYYEAERSNITGVLVKCFETLVRLSRSGITVRMLDTWYDGDGTPMKPDYSIGVHRKILLVDNQWLLTGGRNTNDKYLGEPTGFHYVDLDILLSGNFEDFTLPLIQRLWNDATEIPNAIHQDFLALPKNDEDTTRTTQPDIEECGLKLQHFYNISLVQLDHKGGSISGTDIILSSLIFMIETAKHSVDLAFGMFHLFPPLEEALKCAVMRGIRVRLFTNSPQSNNIWYMSGEVMAIAMNKLLDIGVEIYVPNNEKKNNNNNNHPFCLHYKFATADNHCALVGSWNCFGSSVFYDSDYSIVMFDQDYDSMNNNDNNVAKNSAATSKLQEYLENQLSQGEMIRLRHAPEIPKLALMIRLFVDKCACRFAKRGY